MNSDWNPYKSDNDNKSDNGQANKPSAPAWDFDPRNESFYLGKINDSGNNDLGMRYYTDGKTGRYYRKGEIIPQEENVEINKDPFKNNSLEGKRKRNFSFKLLSGSNKNKK